MAATFHLRFLGPVQVERDGVPVRGFRSRKALALLGYLAVQEHPVPRAHLVDLFWETRPEVQGRANLSWVLNRITTLLPGCLQSDRHTVRFHRTDSFWLDIDTLQALAEQGEATSLATAVALYRGEFLEGLTLDGCAEFEIWLVGERERRRQRVAFALEKLVAHHCQCGEYEQGMDFARRLLALEPWREETHQQMMRLLASSGQRSAALAQYETCRRLLTEELGVEPSKETRAIYDLLLKEEPLPDLFAPLKPVRKPRVVGACPYRGLSAFREEDAPFFFGREGFAERLNEAVRERARVAVIVGSSGSGKSSVVFAELLPRLREEGDWLIVNSRPGAQPFQAQAAALFPLLEPGLIETDQPVEIGELARALSAGETSLPDVAERILQKTPRASHLLLIVDQFEELYTLCPEPNLRERFLDGLLAAVEAVPALTLVLTLRADFMGQALRHRPFADALQESALILGPMTREELQAAIERPAEKQGAAFEEGLVTRVLDDVGKEPGNLPLLEFALALLWERHEQGWLTHGTYEEIGGVAGALTRYADQVYEELDADERSQARHVFGQLVRPGEGTEDTRRVATLGELGEETWALVQHLADRRLVVTGRDITTDRETVEVVHEALIHRWGQLRAWMEEDRTFRIWQERLRSALSQWETTGQDEGVLLRGAPLAEAEKWLDAREVELSTSEREFIQTSIELRERQVAERERLVAERDRRRRRTILALAGGLVVTVVLTLVAVRQRHQALVEASIGLASQAMSELEGSFPERAVPLALEALEHYPYTWQAERALGQAILEGRLRQILPHGGIVNTAEWSGDGRRVLTGSSDGSVCLWDAVTGEELLRITEGAPTLASWSPDERSILTVDGEGTTLRIWDIESGLERLTLDEDDLGGELHVNLEPWEPWSPSGDRFLTTHANGKMTIWEAETASALQSMSVYPATEDQTLDAPLDDLDNLMHLFLGEQGEQALWSPSGDLIATSSDADGTVTVWDANAGEQLYTLPGGFEDQSVSIAGWSPSGEHFATRGLGGTKVYETNTGKELFSLSIPQVYIYRATWSPDGSQLLTAGLDDRTARIWDAQSGQELFSIAGLDQVAGSDWSAAGDTIAIGGQDGVVHMWDIARGLEVVKLFGTEPRIIKVAFSPDGERLLTVGDDNVVNVYDLSEALLKVIFPTGPLKFISIVVWSPDGKQVALGLEDGKARVWNAISGEEELLLAGHTDAIWYVAWSPSGDRIVTGSVDRTVRIWDSTTGKEQLTFTGHEDIILSAEWSPDGSRIASSDVSSGKVIVWNSSTGEQILMFSNHQDFASPIWSPDGKRILSVSTHGEAFIWDAVTGEVLLELFPQDYDLDIGTAAWVKDGERVLLQSVDGIVHTFDATSGKELSQFAIPRASGSQMSLSPTDQRMLKGDDGGARVWDAETGVELLRYYVLPGYNDAVYSPDGRRVLIASHLGTLKIFPTWHSTQELIDYARECCVIRELTAEEREQFGLPTR
jgi:WD40 repeat protein/DNA-binding SARP family transcriptional activator